MRGAHGLCSGVPRIHVCWGLRWRGYRRAVDQQTSRPADQQGSVRMRVGFDPLLRFFFLDVYGFARVPDLDCAARVARIAGTFTGSRKEAGGSNQPGKCAKSGRKEAEKNAQATCC